NQQQSFTLAIGTPHLLGDRLLAFFRLHYEYDPQFDFFSLGNNDVGPDPASTHSWEQAGGSVLICWRPLEHLAVNLGMSLRHVHIGFGDRDDNRPFTIDAFPNMPGIDGGFVNPVSLSIVWTTREDIVRPVEGWRVIVLAAHTDKSMASDFEFTRW